MSELQTCAKHVGGLAITTLPQARKFFSPSWKNVLDIALQYWTWFEIFRPLSENSSPHLVSQAGYGPGLP